jgi:hypothetical protein
LGVEDAAIEAGTAGGVGDAVVFATQVNRGEERLILRLLRHSGGRRGRPSEDDALAVHLLVEIHEVRAHAGDIGAGW